MNIVFFIVILFASLLEYLGDSNFKFYARSGESKYLAYGSGAYIVMVWVLIRILKQSNVMYMNMLWDATSIIMETALAYILLGETLDNNYQMVGFIAILAGIVLMNVGNIPFN